jgi:hypothetical protein
LMGAEWALTLWAGILEGVWRMSWICKVKSSDTEAKRESWRGWKDTSFTTPSWVLYVVVALISGLAFWKLLISLNQNQLKVIPMTDSIVIRGSDEMTLFVGIPRKSITVLY